MFIEYPTEILGIEVETDYKFWLRYVGYVLDAFDLHDHEKPPIIIENVLGLDIDIDHLEALNGIMAFYNRGKEDRGLDPPNEILLHWETDFFTIHSDFILNYHIDINDDNTSMHWWKFMGMFESLPPESKIKTLIQIRAEDISDYSGKGQQKAQKACRQRKLMAAVLPDEYIDDDMSIYGIGAKNGR